MSHISTKGFSLYGLPAGLQLDLTSGQTIGAAFIFAIGGLVLFSKTLSFIRALVSLFILPGKSV